MATERMAGDVDKVYLPSATCIPRSVFASCCMVFKLYFFATLSFEFRRCLSAANFWQVEAASRQLACFCPQTSQARTARGPEIRGVHTAATLALDFGSCNALDKPHTSPGVAESSADCPISPPRPARTVASLRHSRTTQKTLLGHIARL